MVIILLLIMFANKLLLFITYMQKRQTINLKDVQLFFGITKDAAWKRMKKVRVQFNIPKYKAITAKQFCEVHGLICEDLIVYINKRK